MAKFYHALYLLLSFGYCQLTFARPTTNASNIQTIAKGCTSLSINWTNGNGTGRMVIARYDSMPSFVPVDGVNYTSANAFGNSTSKVSQDEYVVYYGPGSSVSITNLGIGRKIYFKVYEYDLNPTLQYLTNNAPSYSDSCYKLHLALSITCFDSCQASNYFKFVNQSNSDIPGIQYRVYNNQFDSLLIDSMFMHFSNSGNVIYYLKSVSNLTGCNLNSNQMAKVFPKKMTSINFSTSTDTVQEFVGNLFKFTVNGLMMPFPVGVTYLWKYGDGTTSVYANAKKSYSTSGRFNVSLINEYTSYNKPTNCRDTQSFTVLVGRDPSENIIVYQTNLWKDSTYIYVSFIDSLIDNLVWRFGDGDSSINEVDSHKYKYGGLYTLTADFTTVGGKLGKYQTYIIVDSVTNSDTSNNAIRLARLVDQLVYPNPSKGLVHLEKVETEGPVTVTLMDTKGALIHRTYSEMLPDTLDLSQFEKGNYILCIESESRLFYFRISLE